jgi:hypothetical protein
MLAPNLAISPAEQLRRETPSNIRMAMNCLPFAFDIFGAENYTSLGRTKIYDAVKAKKLKMHKIDGKTLFLRTDLEAWIISEAVEAMPVPKGGAILRQQEAAQKRATA